MSNSHVIKWLQLVLSGPAAFLFVCLFVSCSDNSTTLWINGQGRVYVSNHVMCSVNIPDLVKSIFITQ